MKGKKDRVIWQPFDRSHSWFQSDAVAMETVNFFFVKEKVPKFSVLLVVWMIAVMIKDVDGGMRVLRCGERALIVAISFNLKSIGRMLASMRADKVDVELKTPAIRRTRKRWADRRSATMVFLRRAPTHAEQQ